MSARGTPVGFLTMFETLSSRAPFPHVANESEDSEELSNLPRVTQLLHGRAWLPTLAILTILYRPGIDLPGGDGEWAGSHSHSLRSGRRIPG